MLYFIVCIRSDRSEQTVPVSSGSTLFATHSAILDTTLGSKFFLFNFFDKYGKEWRCLNAKSKYGKVTDTKIK